MIYIDWSVVVDIWVSKLSAVRVRAWQIETHFSVSHGSDSDRDPGAKRPEILGFSAFMKDYFRLLASTFQSNETTISIYR